MALPPRRMNRNSAPYLSVAQAPHNKKKIFTSERGGKNVFLWNVKARVGFEPVISAFPSRHLYPLHQGPRPMSQTTREMWNISLLHPRSKSLQEPSERAHGHSWAPNIHRPVPRKKNGLQKTQILAIPMPRRWNCAGFPRGTLIRQFPAHVGFSVRQQAFGLLSMTADKKRSTSALSIHLTIGPSE